MKVALTMAISRDPGSSDVSSKTDEHAHNTVAAHVPKTMLVQMKAFLDRVRP